MKHTILLGAAASAVSLLSTAWQDWSSDTLTSSATQGNIDYGSSMTTSDPQLFVSSLVSSTMTGLLGSSGITTESFHACVCSSEKTDTISTTLTLALGPAVTTIFTTAVTTVDVFVTAPLRGADSLPGETIVDTTSTIVQEVSTTSILTSATVYGDQLVSSLLPRDSDYLPTTCVCAPQTTGSEAQPQLSTFTAATVPGASITSASVLSVQETSPATSQSSMSSTLSSKSPGRISIQDGPFPPAPSSATGSSDPGLSPTSNSVSTSSLVSTLGPVSTSSLVSTSGSISTPGPVSTLSLASISSLASIPGSVSNAISTTNLMPTSSSFWTSVVLSTIDLLTTVLASSEAIVSSSRNEQSTLQLSQTAVTSGNESKLPSLTVSSTITMDGTDSITMVVVTTIVTLDVSQVSSTPDTASGSGSESAVLGSPLSSMTTVSTGAAPAASVVSTEPLSVASASSASSSPAASLATSSQPAMTAASSDGYNSCDTPIIPWCITPSTTIFVSSSTATVTGFPIAATSFCACPFCLMASPLCEQDPPSQATSCPDGWLCSLTISYPTSTAWFSLNPALVWQDDLSTWSINPDTLTNTEGASTTALSWSATLSTSTRIESGGSVILFPLRVWVCVGPLCDPHLGLDWFRVVRCLLAWNCKNPFKGVFGFPPPPVPVRPPVGPPSLAYQTLPTTIQPSDITKTTQTTTSASCSSIVVTSCAGICSTRAVSGVTTTTLSEACTQSCATRTTCSGTDEDTATTSPCTEAIALATVVCWSAGESQQTGSSCETSSITTTGCLGSTLSTDSVCTLNPTFIDPEVHAILSSLTAQYPFKPADLSSVLAGNHDTSATTTSAPAATTTATSVPAISALGSLFSPIISSVASKASASIAASSNAYYVPPGYPDGHGDSGCAIADPFYPEVTTSEVKPTDQWAWFDASRPEFMDTLLQFCTHIGKSSHLGHEYFVYTAAQAGHDIGTLWGRNITFAVTWRSTACTPIEKTGTKSCPPEQSWFGCPAAQDGQVNFTGPPQNPDWGARENNQCMEAFKNAYLPCMPVIGGGKGVWTRGGWYFANCLQWSVVSGLQSPTHFWPLQGNGTEIMSEVGLWNES